MLLTCSSTRIIKFLPRSKCIITTMCLEFSIRIDEHFHRGKSILKISFEISPTV